MTELSPAAQAVLDAINKELDEAPWDLSFLAGASAAAALRAAADHLPDPQMSAHFLHALANELEAQ
jgi:hypothetical protein